MGKLQGAAMAQMPMVECPEGNMASSMAPESRKQMPEQTPKYNIQNGGRLNCEKETHL